MVTAFGGEGIGEVDGSCHLIGLDILEYFALQGFGVELIHLGQILQRTLDAFHREEVAGLGSKFAANDVFINAVVACDANVVEGGLTSFADTHFKVDRVAVDIDFNGVEVVEHVTIVVIQVTDGVFVLIKAFVHLCLVIDVAFLHLQHAFQKVGIVDGISYPRDVADIILCSLINVEVYIYVFVVDGLYAVGNDAGVAITP